MKAITHTSLTPLSVQPSATPNPATVDGAVSFTSGVYGDILPYTYLWDFGDGLPTVNTTGLYGYWPLNEASGNSRASILGAAPDLSEVGGAVSEVAGRFSNAMTNTEIYPGPALEAALAPAVGVSAGLTVALWFKMPAWTTTSAKSLVNLRNAGAEPYLTIQRFYNSDFLDIGFRFGAKYLTLPLPRLGYFSEDVWHLLVVRYDATTGKLEGMVDDGCFASAVDWAGQVYEDLPAWKLSATVPPADLATFNAITFDTLNVGKAFSNNHVNGGCPLDDLRIWKRALTAAEVADLWYRSDEEIPVYSYGEAGAQTVTATVTSAHGCEASRSIRMVVS
jgi:hypothetical protein